MTSGAEPTMRIAEGWNAAARFSWRQWDVTSLLPHRWQADAIAVVERDALPRGFEPNRTSREAGDVVTSLVVTHDRVKAGLPWLDAMYEGLFRTLAQSTTSEPVTTASKPSHRVALNAQRGPGMRHECHVDSNPIQAILYFTDHARGSGGEMAVANRSGAEGVSQVDEDCSVIYPVAGHFVVFDARRWPHYVRPLTSQDALRIVAAMNYYLPSCPEAKPPGTTAV